MVIKKSVYQCSECSNLTSKWKGRCDSCGAWNTVGEYENPSGGYSNSLSGYLDVLDAKPVPMCEISISDATTCIPTGVLEIDRVLGGGLLPGSVTLLGGEPGIGKSTLIIQALGALAARGHKVLMICAEESVNQVYLRAERLGVCRDNFWLLPETNLSKALESISNIAPLLVVVDSIQTVFDPRVNSAPGSLLQVRACAEQLVRLAKITDISVILIGHVNKEGALAGPKVLEHIVDTVLSFEAERYSSLKLLRATKHRFGPTGELGVFEMTPGGLSEVFDPSKLWLVDYGSDGSDRRRGVVFATMEGPRALLVELQALVVRSTASMPRRFVQGLDQQKLSMVMAVCERITGLHLGGMDVFASVTSGLKIVEPAVDLPLALSLILAAYGIALPEGLVAIGEVGLGGEVRQVSQLTKRLAEANRLGFKKAIVPYNTVPDDKEGKSGIELFQVRSLSEAFDIVLSKQKRKPLPIGDGQDCGPVRKIAVSSVPR
ncbi:MAG: DNA repair protein RadA [Actinobacteria bacterium]|nr:DNA repair protein RadA [Actinomycetota bacterium]